MEIDAALEQSPATEPVIADQVATETTSEDDAYSAIYDKLTESAPIEAEPEAEEPAPVQEVEPAPTDLPAVIQQKWAEIDPDVRQEFARSQREMSRKLSDMGREVSGLAPIKNVLVEAVQKLPAMGNMKPEQVAQEIFQLAQVSQNFQTKPLETFLDLAKRHNMIEPLRQALGGQPGEANQTAALHNEIRALKQELSRVANPDYFREQVSQVTQQERVIGDVQAFASSAEHWGAVENRIPKVIPLVKERLGESASAKDVLSQAYELALQIYLPEAAKAKVQAADEAATPPNPERAKAAIQAKSVNVTGQPSGKARDLSEDEALAAIYDRAHRK